MFYCQARLAGVYTYRKKRRKKNILLRLIFPQIFAHGGSDEILYDFFSLD
jgi:hypothetical protein